MRKRILEYRIQIFLIITSLVMIFLRFLLNEKGRMNYDSVRFLRTAHLFPEIDNTTTPMGYPLGIWFFTYFGLDEFWASKLLGVLAFGMMIWFAWIKRYYFREALSIGALFSLVSIFSFTMSEAMMLPLVFMLFYTGRQVIIGQLQGRKAFFWLSVMLVLLFNVRYPALFFMGAFFLFGLASIRKTYGKLFIASAIAAIIFVVVYKFTFIDYFNEKYVDTFLEIGLHPTPKLLVELYQGLATTFNPFIHIASPGGGLLNYLIYGIGTANLLLLVVLLIKMGISETEKFLLVCGITGIACSFFIQYFYGITPLDYRLLAPFALPLWMLYFKKLYRIAGLFAYSVPVLSIGTGAAFIFLSEANYLENRKEIREYLKSEQKLETDIYYYINDSMSSRQLQVAELISSVNPKVRYTKNAADTLKKETLTPHRVLSKIKLDENGYQ